LRQPHDRHRWQASSHSSVLRIRPRRSRLAGDGAFEPCANPADAIAGKPAPTVQCCEYVLVGAGLLAMRPSDLAPPHDRHRWQASSHSSVLRIRPRRSRLAGDAAFEPCANPADAIAGKPAPTVQCCEYVLVGAGLPAMRPSSLAPTSRPPSLASQLPQFSVANTPL
jgi:hypothetical protein